MKSGSGRDACTNNQLTGLVSVGLAKQMSKTREGTRFSLHFFLILFIIVNVFIGCGNSKTEIAGIVFDPESTPVIHSEDVSTLISDSGITKLRIVADVWDMYSQAKEPYWLFPEGIYVEQFDTLFNTVGSVKADTAYFFEKKNLWRLVGNVKVLNLKGETFETTELFWDRNKAVVYTDQSVRVRQEGDEVTGIGFRSNQEMTNFTFYKSGALLNVQEETDSISSVNE